MKILLTGSTGGIGLSIKNLLRDDELVCVARADIETKEEFDWLICSHGIINEEDMLETFMANTLSNIRLAETIKTKNIIFISSTAGIKGNSGYPIYSASKSALNTYCKSIAQKVNCYSLCPGPTDTPGWRKLNITDVHPQSPDEVAKSVLHIMEGRYKSGDVIIIRDGREELSPIPCREESSKMALEGQ